MPVAGRDGQLPPIETTSVSETPLTPLGRAGQALKRLVFGSPLDATAIAVERMRKLVALPVLSADALSSVAYGPQAMLAVLVLAGLPGLSYSLPAGAAIAFLMLAVGISYRQTIRAYPQGGGSFIVASEELGRVRAVVAPLANYLWTLHEQRPDLTLTLAVRDLVDRHWWHRIRHEHVAERLQPVLQSLPRVVVSVPFHQAD